MKRKNQSKMMDQTTKHQKLITRQSLVLNSPKIVRGPLAWILIGVSIFLFFIPYLIPGITNESLGAYAALSSLPIALAAYFRAQKGAIFACLIIAFGLALADIHESGLLWSDSAFKSWLLGNVGLFIFGLAAGSFRSLSNRLTSALAELSVAHEQLQRVEEQRTIAYEQRLEALQAEQKMSIALEQERQLHRLKDDFIVNVSHELRTPLTAIFGYIELLNDHKEQIDNTLQTIFLDNIRHGCQELMILVENVLSATQVSQEVPSPKREKISIAYIVHEALVDCDPRIQQDYRIYLNVPEQLKVWADQHYLQQILRNLLSNAFKYAPEHTAITISSTQYKATPSHVCISVKDEGPGIPPDELPLLFGKFIRLKRDLSGNVRGTGLGLYISKQLVEAMKGQIWVESPGVVGEGSQFCFTLPIASSLDPVTEEDRLAPFDPKHSLLTERDVLYAPL